MNFGVITDVGKVREINQDNYYISQDDIKLYIVADGMGGHNAGEVASSMAIDSLKEHIIKYLPDEKEEESIKGIIFEAFNRANREIYKKSQENSDCDGMGTTATLGIWIDDKIYVGHVGDSRGYIIRNNSIEQITQDHSLVAELLRKGSISEREALSHPRKNVITKALGTDLEIKADVFSTEFGDKDIFILCTDGLTNYVEKYEIEDYAISIGNSQEACEKLVALANERGGYDNITVLIVKNEKIKAEGR